jgi:hypothetical protein
MFAEINAVVFCFIYPHEPAKMAGFRQLISYDWELINRHCSPILGAFDLHKSKVPPDYQTLIAERVYRQSLEPLQLLPRLPIAGACGAFPLVQYRSDPFRYANLRSQ